MTALPSLATSFTHAECSRLGLGVHIAKACARGSRVRTKTFIVDFASADEAKWEALLKELKPIEVGALGAYSHPFPSETKKARFFFADISLPFFLVAPTVNNVGVSHEIPADFVDTSPEELAKIINVNVTATLRITSLIAPAMVSRYVPFPPSLMAAARYSPTYRLVSKRGLILNMGSFAGAAPTPMLAVYSGSKAFLRTWSDALSEEMAPKGLVVAHANTYYVVRFCPLSSLSLSTPLGGGLHSPLSVN